MRSQIRADWEGSMGMEDVDGIVDRNKMHYMKFPKN